MSGGCAERAMCVRDHEEPTSAFGFVIPLLSRASKKAPPFAPPFVHALLFTPGWCASSAPGAEPEAFGGVLRLSLPGAPVARRAPPRLGPIPLLDRVGGLKSAGGTMRRRSSRGSEHTYYCLHYLSCKSITSSTNGGGQCTRSGARERQKRQNQRQSTEHRTSTKPEHENT